jgi:integrative and conjugative element protein (TIGR02256 family)
MRVWLTSRALVTILSEAQASSDGRETGGILVGFECANGIFVTEAGGPGARAVRRRDFFLRDLDAADQLLERAFDASRATWVGDWHTHTICDERPSGTDADSYRRLLADAELQFERFLALIVTSASGSFADAEIWPWLAGARGLRRSVLALA